MFRPVDSVTCPLEAALRYAIALSHSVFTQPGLTYWLLGDETRGPAAITVRHLLQEEGFEHIHVEMAGLPQSFS